MFINQNNVEELNNLDDASMRNLILENVPIDYLPIAFKKIRHGGNISISFIDIEELCRQYCAAFMLSTQDFIQVLQSIGLTSFNTVGDIRYYINNLSEFTIVKAELNGYFATIIGKRK